MISNVCDSNVECVTAQANLATNTACTSAFSTGTDVVAICITCRDLFDAIISSCDGTVSQAIDPYLAIIGFSSCLSNCYDVGRQVLPY